MGELVVRIPAGKIGRGHDGRQGARAVCPLRPSIEREIDGAPDGEPHEFGPHALSCGRDSLEIASTLLVELDQDLLHMREYILERGIPWYDAPDPMRGTVRLLALLTLASCDKSGPLATLDAGSPWPLASASGAAVPSPTPEPAASASAAQTTGRAMPPRPVPKTSPTVRVTMPIDTQLQAIQYMAAMQAPQPNDPPADPAYAKQLADGLRAVGKPDVVSSGRRIDILMAKGCDATLPKEAIARHASASLTALLSHGVLVIRCADHELQCLQSTRDSDDVLCTHK